MTWQTQTSRLTFKTADSWLACSQHEVSLLKPELVHNSFLIKGTNSDLNGADDYIMSSWTDNENMFDDEDDTEAFQGLIGNRTLLLWQKI